jgi:P4 family phage/plasmid primase-like protien
MRDDDVDVAFEAAERAAIRDEEPGNGAASTPTAESVVVIEHLTDLGMAKRFALQHVDRARYAGGHGWLVWDDTRWQRDEDGSVDRLAAATAEALWQEIPLAADRAEKKRIADHALRSESAAKIDAMLRLARTRAELVVRADALDADPWVLNVQNGTIDLRTGALRPHRRDDLITKLAPVPYDAAAEAPLWCGFLNMVFAGSAALATYVQRAVGYSLTGDVSEQCLFFAHGPGANGKSTFLNAVSTILGDYAKPADPELLLVKRGEAHPTSRADLRGARFVASIEVEEGRRFAEVLVKWLTGGDPIKARFMREDFFSFIPTHKIWIAANHKPTVRGTDHAIWRRIPLIPFSVRISDVTTLDPHFGDKLRAELPGILAWAVDGCLAWQRDGLNPPPEVRAATEQYRADMDVLAQFLEACCDLDEPDATATAKEIYAAYKKWCEDTGEHALSQKSFGARLTERGFERQRGEHGYRYAGVRVTAG